MTRRYVVIDIETTGNQPFKGDRIFQIGVVVIENEQIIERFSSFVNPEVDIPNFVTQLTSITNEDVDDAPLFCDIAPTILQLLDGAYFVAHNVPFDLSFLQAELSACGYNTFEGPTLDTVEMARYLLPTANGYKLSQLADELNIEHHSPHQADSDAEVTAYLLIKLLNKKKSLPLITLQRLQPLLRHFKSDFDELTQNMIQDKMVGYSDEDDNIEVYNQLAFRRFRGVEKETESFQHDFSTFKEVLTSIDGDLSKQMTHYELREGQLQMMNDVFDQFSNHCHSLIEAGTGTGKTLGYLIPSIFYAKQNEKPIIISTHTIQLQQQIIERDIPVLQKVVPFSFKATVLKGRQHYLCLRKFEQQLTDGFDDNLDIILTKAQILIWLLETETGDIEEINLPSGGQYFWRKVNSEGSTCLNRHCPWFSKCYYHRARRLAKDADIIITNHALLFNDVANDHQMLPSFDEAVIDEAHHLEEVVSDHFGMMLDYFYVLSQFQRLGSTDGNEMSAKIVSIYNDNHAKPFGEAYSTYDILLKEASMNIDELFTMIHQFVKQKFMTSKSEIGRHTYRYDVTKESGRVWEGIKEGANRAVSHLLDFLKILQKINVELEQLKLPPQQKGLIIDFQNIVNMLEKTEIELRLLLLSDDDNRVSWMEIDAKGARNATYLYSKPIEVAQLLADEFFAKKQSVILTSATLTVNGSFDYMIERLGLTDFGPETNLVSSPFLFENQAKLFLPDDLPNIKDVSTKEFVTHIASAVNQLAQVTKGRMLVLFTSYDMLTNTYSLLKEMNEEENFMIFAQGISSGSRAKLTKNFQQFDQSILLGTSSFWEGVDIPGEDLSCLVIVRLPFSPPDNPVVAARSEKIKENGGNPFFNYSLPQAIIRFKQGFGRLLRTSQDRGVVFVLDRRIQTTRYGKSFIRSLPNIPVEEGPIGELLHSVEEWL
jgi:ATP-dependent DNA helicase DinG